jgi:hypothetical protein
MKKLLIATLLIVIVSSCQKKNNVNKIKLDSNKLPMNVDQFNYEGHNYLYYGNGGLIHSESCKCKGGNK